ncbi:zinc finger protein SNAI2-like [Centruroides sculpturatus]|uniref:zinc finger protein SNAI2-like n=1 Tax=Centruroides sculpturatus TaxID=218467 RepID=UPI000C6E4092|nr:zinc finger protein SNAI2-like [Centruroides sculpturatus]
MPRAFLVKKTLQSRSSWIGQDTENSDLSESNRPHDLSIKAKDAPNEVSTPPPAVAMIGPTYSQQYDFPLEPLNPNVPTVLRTAIQRPYYPTYFTNFGGQVNDVYYYPLPSPYSFQGQNSSLLSLSPPPRDLHPTLTDPLRLGCYEGNQRDSLYPAWSPDSTNPVDNSDKVEETRFTCNSCDKSFSTSNGLSKHRQFHCSLHSKKSFSCKHCDKVYVSLGALKMHIRTHTLPCKCKLCGKAFSRPWLLQGHIRTHTGEKPFACSHCNRAFADRSNLRAHLQTHSDVKKYSCRMCTKTFSRMSLLTKHEEGGGCIGSNQTSRSS